MTAFYCRYNGLPKFNLSFSRSLILIYFKKFILCTFPFCHYNHFDFSFTCSKIKLDQFCLPFSFSLTKI